MSARTNAVGLSVKQLKDDDERRKPKDYQSGNNEVVTTLGDLLKQKMDEAN